MKTSWGQRLSKLLLRFEDEIQFWRPGAAPLKASSPCQLSLPAFIFSPPQYLFAGVGVFTFSYFVHFSRLCFFFLANKKKRKQQCSRHLNSREKISKRTLVSRRLCWRDERIAPRADLAFISWVFMLAWFIQLSPLFQFRVFRSEPWGFFASVVCCLTKQINKL